MLYRLLLSYMVPLIEVILSGNRLKKGPQNDSFETFWTVVIGLSSHLIFIAIIPLFIWARLYQPAPRLLVEVILGMCFIISFLLTLIIKKNKIFDQMIEEANKQTKEQHRERRKALKLKFFFGYVFVPGYSVIICILFKYLVK